MPGEFASEVMELGSLLKRVASEQGGVISGDNPVQYVLYTHFSGKAN